MDSPWKFVEHTSQVLYGKSMGMSAKGDKQFYLVTSFGNPELNTLHFSPNYGKDWQVAYTASSGNLQQLAVAADGKKLMVLNPKDRFLLISTTNGGSFEPVPLEQPYDNLFWSQDLATIVMTSANPTACVSLDGGKTLKPFYATSAIQWVGISDGARILYVNGGNKLMLTTDAFLSAQDVTPAALRAGAVLVPRLCAQRGRVVVLCARIGGAVLLCMSRDAGQSFVEVFSFQEDVEKVEDICIVNDSRVVVTTQAQFLDSRDGGVSWYSQPNPPREIAQFGYLRALVADESGTHWLARGTGNNVFRSCDDCIEIPRKRSCVSSKKRRLFLTDCHRVPPCEYNSVSIDSGQAWSSGTIDDELATKWRAGDICGGNTTCTYDSKPSTKGCSFNQNYRYNICEQHAIRSDEDERLEFGCSLGLTFPNQRDEQICCSTSSCWAGQVQDLDEFMMKCEKYRNEKAVCKAMNVDMGSEETIGQACDSVLQDFCTRNVDDPQGLDPSIPNKYKNMRHPACSTWCKKSHCKTEGEKGCGSSWCDSAMQTYCSLEGKADAGTGKAADPQCACLLSSIPYAVCLDPVCTNSDAYRTQQQIYQLSGKGCPDACLQLITVDNVKGNVGISDNLFQMMCNKDGKLVDKDGKPLRVTEYYDCAKDGFCKLAPVGEKGANPEAYKNDPTCGNNCDLQRFDCVDGKCTLTPNGKYLNNNCDGQCLRYACLGGKCVRDSNGSYREPTCGGTVGCEQTEPDLYFDLFDKQCLVSNTPTKYKNDPTCGGKEGKGDDDDDSQPTAGWVLPVSITAGVIGLVLIIVIVVMLTRKR